MLLFFSHLFCPSQFIIKGQSSAGTGTFGVGHIVVGRFVDSRKETRGVGRLPSTRSVVDTTIDGHSVEPIFAWEIERPAVLGVVTL